MKTTKLLLCVRFTPQIAWHCLCICKGILHLTIFKCMMHIKIPILSLFSLFPFGYVGYCIFRLILGHIVYTVTYSESEIVQNIYALGINAERKTWTRRQVCTIVSYIKYYHTPVPILRFRKYGIARPCMYFDVTSLALYKHCVKNEYYRRVNKKSLL
jgi:hypothetical protein